MKKWKIGCSGFSYPEWRNIFYTPGVPQRKWFEYYCTQFNTVELNVTFYRFPTAQSLQDWHRRSPDDFTFAVKAPRVITHYKRFKDAQDDVQRFYDVVQLGLDRKLGSILFQLHPAIVYSEETLERIVLSLDEALPNVIEFRHASWWRNDVLKILRQRNISFCGISHPGLPGDIYHTSTRSYYRFHGVPALYSSKYREKKLQEVYEALNHFKGVEEIYVYFNNTAKGHAIENARMFREMIE
jgi:uncharacterized protein YecE (DUF72 family)